jgi:predicted GNAT family acetyltransferase
MEERSSVEAVRVVDNPAQLRYELRLGDTLAGLIAYRSEPGTVVLVHTDVDPAFEGRGLGGRLVEGALDDIRARGLLLVPLCPFVATWIGRHPEYADLVVDDPQVSD